LLFGLCNAASTPQPMSPCMEARSTYYNYDSQNNGACQFGVIGGTTLPFANVAAANQAYFNNSMACGECYELSGPSGNVLVVIADECPDDGQNPLCDGKIIHFDLGEQATFNLVAPFAVGVVLEKIKKVSCPVTGNLGVYFVKGTSQYYVAFVVYNHKVGLSLVELQPNGGQYYSMTRVSNQWTYGSNQGPTVSLPYNIRLTGQTGEQLVVSLNTYAELTTASSSVQFMDPVAGFGGSSSGNCPPPLPPDIIYDDFLYNGNGASSNAWSDWSFGTSNNFASTNKPFLGTYCWSSTINGFGGIQLGRTLGITWTGTFTELSFAIRADTAYDSIAVSWGGNNQHSITITTTWTVIILSLTTDLTSPASIGVSGAALTFKNTAGTTSPTIFIDELVFLPADNASYVNPNFPAGSGSTGGGGGGSASALSRVPIFVLLAVLFCFLRGMMA